MESSKVDRLNLRAKLRPPPLCFGYQGLGNDRGTTQVLVDPLGFDRDHRGYCPCHLPAAWASVGARTRISNCPFGHGAYFSLHAPPGRNFRAATCLGVRRRSVRTAVHPGASSCCTVDTAASRWVAATQYSILPTPVATTTETPPANVLIMPRVCHGRSGLIYGCQWPPQSN